MRMASGGNARRPHRAGRQGWIVSMRGGTRMRRRGTVVALVISVLVAAFAAQGRAEVKQVPVARLHAMMEIATPPAAVWAQLTTGRNLVTWCPVWKNAKNARVNIVKVGDVLDFTD